MWQRFTERGRRVVFVAQEEAIRLGDNLISTEHLLLGLLRDKDNLAYAVLYRLGISRKRIRAEVAQQIGPKENCSSQNMQLAPLGKRVLELAYDEARLLGNNYIGTEHILLALIRESEGWASRLLMGLGADLDKAREETKRLQAQEEAQRPDQAELRARVLQAIEELPAEVLKRIETESHVSAPPVYNLILPEGAVMPDFDTLFAQYEKRIFRIIYRFIGDEAVAADLTQETFISAYRHYDQLRGDTKVYTWLYQIARNLCIQHARQHGL